MKKLYLKQYNSLAVFNIIFCALYILFCFLCLNHVIVLLDFLLNFILRFCDIFILLIVTSSAFINLHYLKILCHNLDDNNNEVEE